MPCRMPTLTTILWCNHSAKKKLNTKLDYFLDYWEETKSCSSFFSAGEVEGDGGGSSSDYHHPTPNISMEKWVAMPDGRDCQQTAHLLLHEMADELINRYLHVENVSSNTICYQPIT